MRSLKRFKKCTAYDSFNVTPLENCVELRMNSDSQVSTHFPEATGLFNVGYDLVSVRFLYLSDVRVDQSQQGTVPRQIHGSRN